MFKKKIISLIL